MKKFIEKPILTDLANGGFMVFKRKFFEYINPGETEHPALKRLAREKQLSLFEHRGFWFCMDTYKEVEQLNKYWATGEAPWKVWQ